MKRELTEKEKRTIKDYGLPPQVEQVVWDVWSKEKKPMEMSFFKKAISWVIGVAIGFGSSTVLWVNYFVPNIAHMQGMLNMVLFLFWLVLPLMVVVRVIQAVVVDGNEKEAFKKPALDNWRKKTGLYQKIIRLNQFVLVFGFIFNGYIISSTMATICFLAVYFIKTEIRSSVQKVMDKVTPPQDGDTIEAEFRPVQFSTGNCPGCGNGCGK